jgi:diketogulonate reductase-like aldo/keto reductase
VSSSLDQRWIVTRAGVRMPRILYGTAWKKDATARLVGQALACGFRGIDTACQPKHYDEAGVGVGIATWLARGGRREELYLQTKFTPLGGQDPARVPYDRDARPAEQVQQSLAVSQRHLGTTTIDCLVLHSPVRGRETWVAMESLVDAGAVRQLGISNCYDLATLDALCRSTRIAPVVVQNRFHAETGWDRAIRAYCRANGIVYQGFWTLTANPHALAHASLRAIATRHGATPAQVLFRWLVLEGVVPLTGTTSETHMREDLAIFELALDEGERGAVDALFDPEARS